jgi:hypothetical protein
MKILNIGMFSDGGTILLNTDKGDFFIDDRLFSKTKGLVWTKYPDEPDAEIVDKKDEIIQALPNFNFGTKFDYTQAILKLLNERNKN